MPQVPRITEPQVREAGIRTPRIPEPPAEVFDIGREAFEAVSGLSRAAANVSLDEKARADDTITQDAYQRLLKEKNRLLYDQREGALSRTGRNAFGVLDEFEPRFRKTAQDIEATLNNDSQRAVFRGMVSKESTEINGTLRRHILKEGERFENDTFKSIISGLQDDAASNADLPGKVQANLNLMRLAISSFAARRGFDQIRAKVLFDESESKTHVAVIRRMLSNGQFGLADEYAKNVKKRIRSDDLSILKKIRKEIEDQSNELDEELKRTLLIQSIEGRLELSQADELFSQGRIDRTFYLGLRKRILDDNDDPAIGDDKKVQKYLELLDEFKELRGAEVDKKGRLLKPAMKNDLENLTRFRQKVAENSRLLTRRQEADFYRFTQRNFDDAREAKTGIFDALKARLARIQLPALSLSISLSKAFSGIFDPNVTVEQASQEAESIVEQAARQTNPNRSIYKIGQILSLPNGTVKITGFDDDGEPLVELVR